MADLEVANYEFKVLGSNFDELVDEAKSKLADLLGAEPVYTVRSHFTIADIRPYVKMVTETDETVASYEADVYAFISYSETNSDSSQAPS